MYESVLEELWGPEGCERKGKGVKAETRYLFLLG